MAGGSLQLLLGLVAHAFSMAAIMRAGLGSMPWTCCTRLAAHRPVDRRADDARRRRRAVAVGPGARAPRHRDGGERRRHRADGGSRPGGPAGGRRAQAPGRAAAAGIVLNAAATAAYIGVGLGPPAGCPDDRARGPHRLVGARGPTMIEVTVVLTGWLPAAPSGHDGGSRARRRAADPVVPAPVAPVSRPPSTARPSR
ncbi:hypothetical protein HBB16_03630 [Pseudonocardia sp. MCCB 268]|nr:hypothetical protein [Pseudonocardia cytotoxica]